MQFPFEGSGSHSLVLVYTRDLRAGDNEQSTSGFLLMKWH